MDRPKGLTGTQLEYVEYLEKKVSDFSALKTKVHSYHALKKTVDGLNTLMIDGIEITNPETQKLEKHDLLSPTALADKDDKMFDRFFKFIDKLESFLGTIDKLADQISPELLDQETFADEYEEVQAIMKKQQEKK